MRYSACYTLVYIVKICFQILFFSPFIKTMKIDVHQYVDILRFTTKPKNVSKNIRTRFYVDLSLTIYDKLSLLLSISSKVKPFFFYCFHTSFMPRIKKYMLFFPVDWYYTCMWHTYDASNFDFREKRAYRVYTLMKEKWIVISDFEFVSMKRSVIYKDQLQIGPNIS